MCPSANLPQRSSTPPPWRPWEQTSTGYSQNAPKRDQPLKCGHDCCTATFKRESELKRHTISKHDKKHENCKVCGKVFTRKDNLTRHIKLAHSKDEKPFCKHCSKPLSRRDAVQRHESTCPKNPSRTMERRIRFTPQEHISHLQRLMMKHQKSQQN